MSDQSSGGFSPFSFLTGLIGLGYGQVDLRDAERMYSDLTGLLRECLWMFLEAPTEIKN